MDVGVDEAGQHGAAFAVELLVLSRGQGSGHVSFVQRGDKAGIAYHPRGPGPARVQGDYVDVVK